MRTSSRFSVALAAAVALCLLALGVAQAQANPFELDVVTLVNQQRLAIGRQPLGTDVRLFSAARNHSQWMADHDTLSHVGAGGSGPGDRITAAGYTWTTFGETIAAGQATPLEVVLGRTCDSWCNTACIDGRCDGWRQSAAHWSILMSTSYRDIGVGYVCDDAPGAPYRHWWTVKLANSASPATPLPTTTLAASATASRTATATSTATATLTRTATATATATRTTTPTASPSATATATRTALPPVSPSVTASRTATPTALRTATATATRGLTATPSRASTSTPSATPSATLAAGGTLLIGTVNLPPGASYRPISILVDGVWRAQASRQGVFVILGLTPGWHAVTATREGALASQTHVLIRPGVVNYTGDTLLVLGDAYPDGLIDLHDWWTVTSRAGACAGAPAYASPADIDADGCVTAHDLAWVVANYGRTAPTTWSLEP